jgi:hypothetical protein
MDVRKRVPLTEDQKWLVTNSLRVAAEQYEHNARAVPGAASYAGLAEQFRTQAREASDLAAAIENADTVYLAL